MIGILENFKEKVLKKNFDESNSQDDKKFEQEQLERDLNSFSNSVSKNVWSKDDKGEYLHKLNYILDNKGWDKLTRNFDTITLEHKVSKNKDMYHINVWK